MLKTIETERLILRPFTLEDADDVFEYAKNPNVGPHAGWKPHADKEESIDIIQNLFLAKYDCFAIALKETQKVIGSIAFEMDPFRPNMKNSKELGYSMAEEYWGQGLMTEAAKAVISYGFLEMNLDMIAIYRNPLNRRSGRVIDKCGFTFEGTLRKANKIYDGTVRDVNCYSMTREEFNHL